jgi:hypothetical protein
VLNDTQPSGYGTNYASFAVTEFGLAAGSSFDAVRIRSCCGADAHFDLLAVAAIPEPNSAALVGIGLLGLVVLRRRNPLRQPPRASEGAVAFTGTTGGTGGTGARKASSD